MGAVVGPWYRSRMIPRRSITNTHGSVVSPHALNPGEKCDALGWWLGPGRNSSTWTKFALAFPNLWNASVTSSVTGPHRRLWQSRGVENTATVGLPLFTASARDT